LLKSSWPSAGKQAKSTLPKFGSLTTIAQTALRLATRKYEANLILSGVNQLAAADN